MDRYLNVTEARQGFLELVGNIEADDRVIITKRGKPRAVLVDFEQDQLLKALVWVFQDPARRAAMQESWEEMKRGQGVRLPPGVKPTVKSILTLAKRTLRKRRRKS